MNRKAAVRKDSRGAFFKRGKNVPDLLLIEKNVKPDLAWPSFSLKRKSTHSERKKDDGKETHNRGFRGGFMSHGGTRSASRSAFDRPHFSSSSMINMAFLNNRTILGKTVRGRQGFVRSAQTGTLSPTAFHPGHPGGARGRPGSSQTLQSDFQTVLLLHLAGESPSAPPCHVPNALIPCLGYTRGC